MICLLNACSFSVLFGLLGTIYVMTLLFIFVFFVDYFG